MGFSAFKDSERDGWSARSGAYDDATARATRQSIPTLLAHARLFPAARVLDAGCGTGDVAACCDLLGARAEGVDFARGMVDAARARFPAIPFDLGDVEDLAHPDGTFDAVLSNIVLFHLTDPDRAAREAFRVLKPGGSFAFSQWLGPDRSDCYRVLFDALGRHADMGRADPAPDAFRLSDAAAATRMLESAGFAAVRAEVVENVLHCPGPSFFDFFMRFGVRVPLILDRQDHAVRAKIREEVDAAAAAYRAGDGFRIPMPSVVYSARKG